jgi:hypothetical protein
MTVDTEGGSGPRTRRARDRGFQRPSGPALVARPEPLAGPDPAPGTERTAPATPEPLSAAASAEPSPPPEAAEPAANTPAPDNDLPMPPTRHSEIRVQFNTKLRPAVIERTKGFADRYHANIQDIVEQALDEYMTRRGWPAGRKRS